MPATGAAVGAGAGARSLRHGRAVCTPGAEEESVPGPVQTEEASGAHGRGEGSCTAGRGTAQGRAREGGGRTSCTALVPAVDQGQDRRSIEGASRRGAAAKGERERLVRARGDRWALNVCFCCSNQAAARKRPAPVKSVALTAQEVFLEAAKTAVENTRSLEALLKVKDANRSQGPPKAPVQGRRIIRRSRVGCADSITFTEVDDFPAVINAVAPPCMLWPCLGLLWKVAADVCHA